MKALRTLTTPELKELIEAAQAEITKRKNANNLVSINWSVDWYRADRQRPYLAIITKKDNKLSYKFLNSFTKENSGVASPCHAAYTGELPVGTILKARTGGSMKNEYLDFYEVTANGLVEIEAGQALRKIGL